MWTALFQLFYFASSAILNVERCLEIGIFPFDLGFTWASRPRGLIPRWHTLIYTHDQFHWATNIGPELIDGTPSMRIQGVYAPMLMFLTYLLDVLSCDYAKDEHRHTHTHTNPYTCSDVRDFIKQTCTALLLSCCGILMYPWRPRCQRVWTDQDKLWRTSKTSCLVAVILVEHLLWGLFSRGPPLLSCLTCIAR